MVHALKQAHRMLQPHGRLVDVHDLPVPHPIEVDSPGMALKAGWLLSRDDFESERYALNAISQVVSEGLFMLEDELGFDFNYYTENLPELQRWLADDWKSAVIPVITLRRLEELLAQAPQTPRIVLKVQTRMICLRVV